MKSRRFPLWRNVWGTFATRAKSLVVQFAQEKAIHFLAQIFYYYAKPNDMSTPTTATQLKKILIIEDEGDICLLLNIMLKRDEIDLEHVRTIAAAKEFLKEERPSLVLLDNKLPDGFGVDFIDYIRNNYPNIKILMISGFQASAVKDVALFAGADGFLEKPFTKQQVYDSVQALLN